MNDEELRRLVIDALEADPRVSAADIGVAASNGVITLTGHVSNLMEKYEAEQIVQRIKGVRGIAEEIQIRSDYEEQISDDHIASRIVDMLTWNVLVPNTQVQVKVQQGWVTLSGEVNWHFQRNSAEAAVRRMAGVKGVTNLIGIRDPVHITDVKERIEAALKRSAELEASDIQVEVHDRKVTLQGKVRTWAERDAAERAAWNAPGVITVDDKLQVVPG